MLTNQRKGFVMSSKPDPPTPVNASPATRRWYLRIWGRLEEPQVVTAVQILTFLVASAAGVVAVAGGFPYSLTHAIGALAFAVGAILLLGGLLGAVSCWKGVWWLERIALLLCGLGWVMFVPALFYVPLRLELRTFFILLVCTVIFDIIKRYRRIDWAYLDPTK